MVFSVTKSVVGIVCTRLIVEGVIDENAEVSTYLQETANGGYGSTSVRQLMDMTANIRFVEDYDGPDLLRYRLACGQVPSP
jgi:CubicO group peptidase (beta-lactamase class C family)